MAEPQILKIEVQYKDNGAGKQIQSLKSDIEALDRVARGQGFQHLNNVAKSMSALFSQRRHSVEPVRHFKTFLFRLRICQSLLSLLIRSHLRPRLGSCLMHFNQQASPSGH